MRKNILFFILVSVLSLATARQFGNIYNLFSPQESSAFWGLDTNEAISFVGFFLAYSFLVPIFFELFGYGNRKKLILWFLLPIGLLWIFVDIYYIYIPIAFGLTGFILAKIINFVISKFHRPNFPIEVK